MIYFFAVVEEGSFSSAAKRLFISQPALSYQISVLEDELGIPLFDRKKNRVFLNESGREFYKECKNLYEQYQEIYQKIRKTPNNEIRIGFTGAFENRELLNVISQFKKLEPNVTFSFIKNNFEGSALDLINEKVDISFGIQSTFKNLDSISYLHLYDYEICIICSYQNPLSDKNEISLKELQNENFIFMNKEFGSQFYNDIFEGFRKSNFHSKIKRMVSSFDELIFNVSSNEGIALASPDVIRSEEIKSIKLISEYHKSAYVLAYRENKNNLLLGKFIDFTEYYFNAIN